MTDIVQLDLGYSAMLSEYISIIRPRPSSYFQLKSCSKQKQSM